MVDQTRKKQVVFTALRSGSNILLETVGKNTNILGEYFNDWQSSSVENLNYLPGFVGFTPNIKTRFEQLKTSTENITLKVSTKDAIEHPEIFEWLIEDGWYFFINLRDEFEQMLSWQLALATNEWFKNTPVKPEIKKVTPNKVHWEFASYHLAPLKFFIKRLNNTKHSIIFYEDIVVKSTGFKKQFENKKELFTDYDLLKVWEQERRLIPFDLEKTKQYFRVARVQHIRSNSRNLTTSPKYNNK